MIIGSNNKPGSNGFKRIARRISSGNIFTRNVHDMQYTNVNDKKEMREKSIAMLNERLQNGTITLEEFNKQCEKLNKIK